MLDVRTQCAHAALTRMAQPPSLWMTDLCDSAKQRRRERCLHAALERFVRQPQKQCARPLKLTVKRQAVDSKVRETADALLPRPHWTKTQGRTARRVPVADPIKRACTPAITNRYHAALWMKEWNAEDRRERSLIRKRRLSDSEGVRSGTSAS